MVAPMFDAIAQARVGVLGDLMLDRHVYGKVSRVSEEAPVPILHAQTERLALGGAGNVAANIAALGAHVRLAALVGADAASNELARLLAAEDGRIEPTLIVDADRPTVVKTRYIANRHQIMRVDHETLAPAPPAASASLVAEAQRLAADCAVLVASDYGKGALAEPVLAALFEAAAAHARCVIVDPKREDFAAYRGASVITPNRKELTRATGLPCESDAEAERAARAAIAASGAAILLTRSEKGMTLFRDGREPLHLPTEAKEVFDVTGAGDTVVAALAAGLAAGAPIEQALRLANACAGIVVGKLGAAVATPAEAAAALMGRAGGDRRRGAAMPVVDLRAARGRRLDWAAAGLSVGFTNGCFDLVHPGHVALISEAAAACDRLIVALNSDASVRRLKGPSRPLQPLEARAAVIGAIRGVDLVVAFDEDTPLEAIRALEPDVLVKGADYRPHEVVGADFVTGRGGKLVLVDLVAGQSTTAIAARANGG